MPATQAIAARSAKREPARFLCTITTMGQSARGRVVNLSETGLCVMLFERFQAPAGTKVIIMSPELGRIDGTLRWIRDSKAGVEFKLSTAAIAQISAYFRFFHEAGADPQSPRRLN